jgi:hypothetical protein
VIDFAGHNMQIVYFPDLYSNSSEAIGQHFTLHKRDKSLEKVEKKGNVISVFNQDPWYETLKMSKSIRTHISDTVLLSTRRFRSVFTEPLSYRNL